MIHFNEKAYIRNLDDIVPRKYDYRRALESGDWTEWQRGFRKELADLTGLSHVRAATQNLPLSPRIVDRQEFPHYIREKGYITTEPGIEIPFYLLFPKDRPGPFPLVLTPHGHGRKGKELYVANLEDEQERNEMLAVDRDVALQAVGQGYAVIAMDVRGFWEMGYSDDYAAERNNSCTEMQKRAYMYGRTLIGERVHDMGRLIDYAITRPEIDTGRIAITGGSGGGTVSLFTAALDERISVSVPVCYFCTFHGSIMAVHHCLCNFIPGMLRLGELYDVVGLIAPRPLLFVNGKLDPIFPIEHTREAFAHVKRIYQAMGAPERCELHEVDGGHRYYKAPVWPFVRRHFI